ncbi:Gfo/Idh/MocA family protein [candidate division CSSED10-310 bacterium]|uniref:Gfo/Idh/MocA family protein n=1 Tax=candidate division CSSED10-310 bacterium TaxID=2855610 RepID=A0ABV6YWW5_UNCC1
MVKSRYNVAMIGVGDITTLHYRAYQNFSQAHLYKLCDIDKNLLERRRQEWGVEKITMDYREILVDPDVDIVEVNTPHHLHQKFVVEALDAGKHVSCQKPISPTLVEAQAMIEAEERNSGQLRIFENFVYYPAYQRAKSLIEAGDIGEPLSIRFKLGSGIFGSRWVPLQTELWHLMESEKGMGQAIFDDGYHKLSLAIFFMGEIERVKGFIDRSFKYIDEPGQLIWKYKDKNVLGSFDLAFSPNIFHKSAYYPCDERVDIMGTKGFIKLSGCTGRIRDEAPLTLYRDGQVVMYEDLDVDWQASFTAGIRDFPLALMENRDSLISARRALNILKFAYALIIAAKIGTEIAPDDVTDDYVRQILLP